MAEAVVVPREQQGDFKTVEAPYFYASGFRVSLTSTDIVVTLQRAQPAVRVKGDGPVDAAEVVAVAVLGMSLHAAKDFSILLADIVKAAEADYGEIVTDYTRKLKAEKAKADKK